MNNKFKKSILALSLVASFSITGVGLAAEASIADSSLAPNEYDCTPEELTSYIEKKSEGIVQRDTSIADFESFKVASRGVGSNLDTYASQAGGIGNSSLVSTQEDCDYFWGDIDDISIDGSIFDKISGIFTGGGLGSIYDAASERITEVADGMISNIKKGLCKRLNTSTVKKQVYNYGDRMLKDQTGYNSRVVDNPNILINGVLSDNLGSSGRLLNINDTSLDSARTGAVSRETNRQMNLLY
jgi:hypothetical protein